MASACFRVMTVLLGLFVALAVQAQPVGKGPHVHIALAAESVAPAPGSELTLALVETPDPGWHAYWENPGDAGFPAEAKWTLPAGMSAGELRYPVPQRLTISGLMNYVYEAPFAPLVTLKVPAGLAPGSKLPVALHLKYLVCTDAVCVPEDADLSIALTVGDGAISPEARARFDAWRQKLPKPLGAQASYQVTGEQVRIGVPFPAAAKADDAYFYAATDGAVDYAAPQSVARDGDRLVIETRAKVPSGAIDGVLAAGGMGFEVHAVAGTVPPAKGSVAAADSGWGAILAAFGGAVLGGLLLNIMPCVFPILSLKALSLAKANDADGRPRAEALAYTAGVVLVCVALGGVLLALRAGGATLGWGFQLQDPRMILLLLLLVTGIALNLAGLFEINTPGLVNRAASKGAGGAFATGALAAFIATPCSGPFMGAALGAALVLPVPAALALFAGLGLGIALPFLALGFIPMLRRRLPRPGGWMVTFRRILSVPMFLTAAALLWVIWRQAGPAGLIVGVLAAVFTALMLWGVGVRQRRGKPGALLIVPALVAAAIGGILVHPVAGTGKLDFGEPFSEARLAELTKQGRPVFAYFTADWCLTCKVNEKAVIETSAVEQALADGKVAVLVGDWTNGDAALGRFIERHNRAGVPLYLWYKPGAAEPEVLPQILTQAMIEARAKGG